MGLYKDLDRVDGYTMDWRGGYGCKLAGSGAAQERAGYNYIYCVIKDGVALLTEWALTGAIDGEWWAPLRGGVSPKKSCVTTGN